MPSPNAPHPDPASAHHAADALRDGAPVVFPTETVFGVGIRADIPRADNALFAAAERAGRPIASLTWHAPSAGAVRSAAYTKRETIPPLHERIFHRLLPGPVRLLLPRGKTIRNRLGAAPGVLDSDGQLAVRAPDHAGALELLRLAESPIAAVRLTAVGFASDTIAPSPDEIESLLGPSATLFDAPPSPRYKTASTTIALTPAGGYELIAEGAAPADWIDRRVAINILFICTGNTCRSPMAQAIALALLDARRLVIPVRVRSAGLYAAHGAPMTSTAREALEGQGITPRPHSATLADKAEILSADLVFTMTSSHKAEAIDIAPEAEGRIHTLDPAGADVPDPVGGPLSLYDQTAQRIKTLIEARLDQFLPETQDA